MSYSLNTPCHNCQKRSTCADHDHIRGAIDGIHMAGSQRGHLGSGKVDLTCQNFTAKEE